MNIILPRVRDSLGEASIQFAIWILEQTQWYSTMDDPLAPPPDTATMSDASVDVSLSITSGSSVQIGQ